MENSTDDSVKKSCNFLKEGSGGERRPLPRAFERPGDQGHLSGDAGSFMPIHFESPEALVDRRNKAGRSARNLPALRLPDSF
jgi:hypothetical protein